MSCCKLWMERWVGWVDGWLVDSLEADSLEKIGWVGRWVGEEAYLEHLVLVAAHLDAEITFLGNHHLPSAVVWWVGGWMDDT